MISLKNSCRFFKSVTAAVLCLALCGCGSIYDREYVYESEYIFQSDSSSVQSSVSVRNLSELTSEIRRLVSGGKKSGSVVFSEDYSGEPSADMASACWIVRTQDALCAYCVDNISYELSRIVSYYEADIRVDYSNKGVPFNEIRQIPYSFGLDEVIRDIIRSGTLRAAVLINQSVLTPSNVEDLIKETYKNDPILSPCAPKSYVSLFSGSNLQKLYEIRITYPVLQTELERQRKELSQLEPFSEEQLLTGDYEKTQTVLEYFNKSTIEEGKNTVYNSLIEKNSDSEGISLGFVALCNMIGLESKSIEGQYNYGTHFWNLVRINGDWYHIDAEHYVKSVNEGQTFSLAGNPLSDTEVWGNYRWDTSAYPECKGILPID